MRTDGIGKNSFSAFFIPQDPSVPLLPVVPAVLEKFPGSSTMATILAVCPPPVPAPTTLPRAPPCQLVQYVCRGLELAADVRGSCCSLVNGGPQNTRTLPLFFASAWKGGRLWRAVSHPDCGPSTRARSTRASVLSPWVCLPASATRASSRAWPTRACWKSWSSASTTPSTTSEHHPFLAASPARRSREGADRLCELTCCSPRV